MKHNIYYIVITSQLLLGALTCFGSVEQLAVGLQKIALTAPSKGMRLGFSDEGRPLPSYKKEEQPQEQPRMSVPDVPAASSKQELSKKDAIINRWNKQTSMLWNPQSGNILEVTLDDDRIGSLSTLIDELDAYVQEKKSSSIPSSDVQLFNDYIQALKVTLNVIALTGSTVRQQKDALESEALLKWLATLADTLKKRDENLKSLVMKLQQTNSKDYPSTKEIKKLLVDLAGPIESLHQEVRNEIANLRLKTRFEFDQKERQSKDKPRMIVPDVPAASPKQELSKKDEIINRWNKQTSMLWNPQSGNILEVTLDDDRIGSLSTLIDELDDYVQEKKSSSILSSDVQLFNDYIQALKVTLNVIALTGSTVRQQKDALESEALLKWLATLADTLKKRDENLKSLVMKLQQTNSTEKDIKTFLVNLAQPVQALYKQILKEIADLRSQYDNKEKQPRVSVPDVPAPSNAQKRPVIGTPKENKEIIRYGTYEDIGNRLAQVTTRILDGHPDGPLKKNIFTSGISKEEQDAWSRMLTELSVYIEKNEATANNDNKKLFKTGMTKLYLLSNQLFNVIELIHTKMLNTQGAFDLDAIMAQIDKLKQSRAELIKLQSEVTPGVTEFRATKVKEIKNVLKSFVVALVTMYNRALDDKQKEGLYQLYKQRGQNNKQEN